MNRKFKIGAISVIALALLASCATESNTTETIKEDGSTLVVTRTDEVKEPRTFIPVAIEDIENQNSETVVTYSQRLLNEETTMLKTVDVYNVDNKNLSSWQFSSDEGGTDHEQAAPNPLSFLTAGITSDLLTQLQRGIDVLELDVDSVKVEVQVDFSWRDMMTPNWRGYTDKVLANIIIESNENEEAIEELKEYAINSWASGEGFKNSTSVDADFVVTRDYEVGQTSNVGSVPSDISLDGDFTLSQKTGSPDINTFELGEDVGGDMDMGSMPSEVYFSVVATAVPYEDENREYMNEITVRALQDNYTGWILYADDSYTSKGVDKAPTSWDYVTGGTSLCLMSQLSLMQMMFPQVDDFSISHQFLYTQDDFMSDTMSGNTLDNIITRCEVYTQASDEEAKAYFYQSLSCCFAGEAFTGETEMDTNLYLNNSIVE
ncbi:MAG: hypothetical protein ACPKM0_01005 [Pleomorphochaeta sp.]